MSTRSSSCSPSALAAAPSPAGGPRNSASIPKSTSCLTVMRLLRLRTRRPRRRSPSRARRPRRSRADRENVPAQMKRMSLGVHLHEVAACSSAWVTFSGTNTSRPSSSLSSACCTPSPPMSRLPAPLRAPCDAPGDLVHLVDEDDARAGCPPPSGSP